MKRLECGSISSRALEVRTELFARLQRAVHCRIAPQTFHVWLPSLRRCRGETLFALRAHCGRDARGPDLPIANRLAAERTKSTPSDNAGVAISNSPIELVAR